MTQPGPTFPAGAPVPGQPGSLPPAPYGAGPAPSFPTTTAPQQAFPPATTTPPPQAFPPAAPVRASRARISGVDVARSIAILGMLVAHLGTGHYYPEGGWGEEWMWIFDGRSSALFATLAGVSIAIMSQRARTAAPHEAAPLWRSVRVKIAVRAALLLPIGIGLQLLGTPVAIILPTYAVLFLMALPLLRLSTPWLLGVAALAVVVGPVVVLGLRQVTTDGVHPTLLNFGFGIGELVWGYYPALVWIGYLVVGMVLGRLLLARRTVGPALLGAGLAIAALGYGGGTLLRDAVTSATFEPDFLFWPDVLLSVEPHSSSTFEVLGNIGVALAVTGLCLLLTTPKLGAQLLWPLAATGSMALTIYTAQIVVIAMLGDEAVYFPTSNTPLLTLALSSILFASLWRAALGQGPLERLLKFVSDGAAKAAERSLLQRQQRQQQQGPPW